MIYAVGDIHGRADLLGELHEKLKKDWPPGIIVYLGDYIDRGPQSARVIDILLDDALPEFRQVFLRGNHEEMLLLSIDYLEAFEGWLEVGGLDTLASYGVGSAKEIPRKHLDFIRATERSYETDEFFFCHAGVDPDLPLLDQDPDDLFWITEPFLSSKKDFGKVVVHGHTPGRRPQVRPNRIGIDTDAWRTGCLTAVALDGSCVTVIETGTRSGTFGWLRGWLGRRAS